MILSLSLLKTMRQFQKITKPMLAAVEQDFSSFIFTVGAAPRSRPASSLHGDVQAVARADWDSSGRRIWCVGTGVARVCNAR